jgi:HEPN domain-containing protein
MKPLTHEWVEKAEGDFITAAREYRARKSPNYDAACFHAQQCAEKYLKARLQEAEMPFGRTHNLTALLDLLLPIEPLWEMLRPQLRTLTIFAVDVRYPGESADKAEAREALNLCREVRRHVRSSLGLKTR